MLDRERQERAAARARRHQADAEYHEQQVRAALARVQTIVTTWSLDPVTFEPIEPVEAND